MPVVTPDTKPGGAYRSNFELFYMRFGFGRLDPVIEGLENPEKLGPAVQDLVRAETVLGTHRDLSIVRPDTPLGLITLPELPDIMRFGPLNRTEGSGRYGFTMKGLFHGMSPHEVIRLLNRDRQHPLNVRLNTVPTPFERTDRNGKTVTRVREWLMVCSGEPGAAYFSAQISHFKRESGSTITFAAEVPAVTAIELSRTAKVYNDALKDRVN